MPDEMEAANDAEAEAAEKAFGRTHPSESRRRVLFQKDAEVHKKNLNKKSKEIQDKARAKKVRVLRKNPSSGFSTGGDNDVIMEDARVHAEATRSGAAKRHRTPERTHWFIISPDGVAITHSVAAELPPQKKIRVL